MKKIINAPETVVIEMCNGIAMAHPHLELIAKYKIIKKKEINRNKVSLISGGGSGHEPAHAGFVGKGMLDAAVCGDVFASPSQIQIYKAIQATASNQGTLLIIKNYSGDVMNFKNAARLAQEDTTVDYVIVNDDIAVKDSLYTVGRRGVAGTVLVHKIAGAAAEMGQNLPGVKAAAENAIANIRSLGVAFSSCTVPAKGTPTFEIGENEMEFGVGIHGEPGISREKAVTADELAHRMINALTEELGMVTGDETTLLVNGFGSTPMQELYLLSNAAFREIAARGITVYRVFVGNFMTSIDMMGASITLMKMNAQLRELLSAECDAPAFHVNGETPIISYIDRKLISEENKTVSFGMYAHQQDAVVTGEQLSLKNMIYLVDRMGTYIIENEVPFCELDAHAGDGDFGMSIAKGFKQLKREWPAIMEENCSDIGTFLEACALIIMEYCGGASGPIWGSAFHAAARAVKHKITLNTAEFAEMMQSAVRGIQQTGACSFGRGAVVGDKTLIDALVPCADVWSENAKRSNHFKAIFSDGAKSAVQGAKKTEAIIARMGRAGAVGERSLGYPDAGAYALGQIFTDLAKHLG
ncbi:MAG: dihydroxyacetone kinase subunit DhaK [Clostridia bacterium]